MKRARASEAYAVMYGELKLNGRFLDVSPLCVELCLKRHGIDPEKDHKRIPLGVGRHIRRIWTFVGALTLAREIRLTNA